jgi:hypothetical protein
MNPRLRFPRLALGVALSLPAGASLLAQAAPDVAPPELREKTVIAADAVLESRSSPTPLPSPLPNPFIAKEPETQAVAPGAPVAATPAEPALSGAELLARLAARIPSTGTVFLGGQPILLLGQKRLNVGDAYSISLDGKTFEVTLAAVSSTSFTVKRGELLHTRPVRTPASSTTPRP